MLLELYQTIDSPEEIGKDILLPDYTSKPMYLSQGGEFFCYSGIYLRDNEKISFHSWPYYLGGTHSTNQEKLIKGLFRIKNGCILLTGFVDHEFYNNSTYKQLKDYVISLPTVNTSYFGIEKRIETEHAWYFEENIELSRACFGLAYSELEYLVEVYAKRLGTYNSYFQYPRITRSLKNDNFCDITGLWIPAGFPYIAFNESGYDFGHISLFGFYRHVNAMLSIGTNTIFSQIFEDDANRIREIINQIAQIDNYFPFEIMVTREYIIPEMYVK
ncbi:hypothetical protein J25TS5_30810 [Paenibacillus faecis]|uniref:hypothetical protein n=1 Tax=Paenibacillus faecis TaxID=862114 RepID=UPI001B24B165|nr:hypothetical protein [Paenibacillus faecis]GIO86149.1 hypothetical protein J25TS5_30810 [Paenibacillus faecis]